MKYRSIPVPVDADHFLPTPGQTDNLPKGVQAVENRMGGWDYHVGYVLINPGDWIVHTKEGEDLVFPDDVFNETFEPVPEEIK